MKKVLKVSSTFKSWIKYVPNSLTICNSLCGFASIIVALGYNAKVLKGEIPTTNQIFVLSAWLILGAMIFDCLDGFSARLLNACSMHGLQMDSLSDMVTFGVAPATLVTAMTYSLHTLDLRHSVCVWILSAVYLGCAALRLATYNVHAMQEKKSESKFYGLPSPGAAAAICTTVIFYDHLEANLLKFWWVLPVYGAILGLLMVSNIRYLHVGKWLTTVRQKHWKMVLVAVLLILLIIRLQLVAFLLVNLYILCGILAALYRRIFGKKERGVQL